MRINLFLTLFVSQVSLFCATFVPSRKCHLKDGNCLKAVAQSAVPNFTEGRSDLGIVPLDIMHVDKIDVDLSGLVLNMRDINIYGLKKTTIDDISFDMNKKHMKLKYHVDVVLKGKYKTSGSLLSLPISGDGDVVFTLDHFEVSLAMPFEIIKNDDNGKDIVELKSYKYKFDVKKNFRADLTNLFNGNKVLGNAMLNVINNNWKLLIKDLGRAILEKPMLICYTAIKTYLHSTPLNSIAEY